MRASPLVWAAAIGVLCVAFDARTLRAQTLDNGDVTFAYWNLAGGNGRRHLAATNLSNPATPFTCRSSTGTPVDDTVYENGTGAALLQPNGAMREALVQHITKDPTVVALGVGEAWGGAAVQNVLVALGWFPANATTQNNGNAIVTRYGFVEQAVGPVIGITGAEQHKPIYANVCLNADCTKTMPFFALHMQTAQGEYDAYMAKLLAYVDAMVPSGKPRVILGDFNAWDTVTDPHLCVGRLEPGASHEAGIRRIRDAGYADMFRLRNPSINAYTGQLNVLAYSQSATSCVVRAGLPQGHPYKAVDHAFSRHIADSDILAVTKFGIPFGGFGNCAASDHLGLKVRLRAAGDVQAVDIRLESSPPGLRLAIDSEAVTAPASRTVIVGSAHSISAPSPQVLAGITYEFASWSNGGTQTQTVTAASVAATYRATFRAITTTVPAPWISGDIGAVGMTGSTSYSNGSFTIRGAGADIWGAADAFHFTHRSMAGDGTIVARIAALSGSDAWTKVGVMIRASSDPGAAHALMLVSTSKGFAFQRRTTAGGLSTHTPGPAGTAPRWVRLVRVGNVLTASVSPDGATWTTVGHDTIALPETALVGLAVTSHRTTALATGTVDNVSVVEKPGPVLSGWQQAGVGLVGQAGSSSVSAGTFTVRGAGADVWGTSDAFHFVYRTLTGDADVVARVATVTASQPWAKVGVMIRDSVAANAAHGFMLVSAGKGLAFQRRVAAGGVSTHTTGDTGTAPRWVKLSRRGDTITASVSADGTTWRVVGSDTIPMTGEVHAGLAVTSHDASQLATGTFDQVAVTP